MTEFENQIALLKGDFSTVFAQAGERADPGLMTALEGNVSEHAATAGRVIRRVRAQMSAELRGETLGDDGLPRAPARETPLDKQKALGGSA
jgi:hypothetical protein